MIEDITIDRMTNAICQDTSFNGTYVLVEGNNDYTLFRKFFKNEVCEIKVSFGKDTILEVIANLEQRGFKNAIAILDSDFHNLDDTKPTSERIFFTDGHDLESLIFQSDAIHALMDQYCIKEKVEAFLKEHDQDHIRKAILNLISPLGYLKWANQKNNWGILFKPKDVNGSPLKIEDFIPVNTIKFDGYDKMVATVLNYSRGKVQNLPKKEIVIEHMHEFCKQEVDKHQLCNGHDISYLFSLALRKKISNLNSKSVSASQIENDLILAYDSRYFETTSLYQALKEWEHSSQVEILKF